MSLSKNTAERAVRQSVWRTAAGKPCAPSHPWKKPFSKSCAESLLITATSVPEMTCTRRAAPPMRPKCEQGGAAPRRCISRARARDSDCCASKLLSSCWFHGAVYVACCSACCALQHVASCGTHRVAGELQIAAPERALGALQDLLEVHACDHVREGKQRTRTIG